LEVHVFLIPLGCVMVWRVENGEGKGIGIDGEREEFKDVGI
jgi:hypothetical protein